MSECDFGDDCQGDLERAHDALSGIAREVEKRGGECDGDECENNVLRGVRGFLESRDEENATLRAGLAEARAESEQRGKAYEKVYARWRAEVDAHNATVMAVKAALSRPSPQATPKCEHRTTLLAPGGPIQCVNCAEVLTADGWKKPQATPKCEHANIGTDGNGAKACGDCGEPQATAGKECGTDEDPEQDRPGAWPVR